MKVLTQKEYRKLKRKFKKANEISVGRCGVVYKDSIGSIKLDSAIKSPNKYFGEYLIFFALPKSSKILGFIQ